MGLKSAPLRSGLFVLFVVSVAILFGCLGEGPWE